MRELAATGFMHNRVRMVVASFLTKDLLTHWQRGERWFMQHLVDGDLANNNGGWQWAAGTGTDAQPYFRVFNPEHQLKSFDPASHYVDRWVNVRSHAAPIVQHHGMRDRALELYRAALRNDRDSRQPAPGPDSGRSSPGR